jgi:DNA-binding transcriptional MerR regulator
MFNSGSYKKRDYCTAINGRCAGFLCEDYRQGICKGILWAIANKDGSIIAQMPPLNDEDENILEFIMKTLEEIHKAGYLTKDEVINILESKFKIKLSKRMLKYYGTQEIIDPGIVTQLPGIRGSVSIYKERTPEIINFINILKKHHKFTLKEIVELSSILSFKNKEKVGQYWQIKR